MRVLLALAVLSNLSWAASARTPLMEAAANHDVAAVRRLLATAKPGVDARTAAGETALSEAYCNWRGSRGREIAQLLRGAGAREVTAAELQARGERALVAGRNIEALRWFRCALGADAGHAPAHYALARLLAADRSGCGVPVALYHHLKEAMRLDARTKRRARDERAFTAIRSTVPFRFLTGELGAGNDEGFRAALIAAGPWYAPAETPDGQLVSIRFDALGGFRFDGPYPAAPAGGVGRYVLASGRLALAADEWRAEWGIVTDGHIGLALVDPFRAQWVPVRPCPQ